MPQTPNSVFITGASSGLGRGLALRYAQGGATVHAAARREDELRKLASEAPPGSILPVRLDVQDTDALVAAIRGAEQASGGDRKSTRLNSSHMSISYAVFCWRKK